MKTKIILPMILVLGLGLNNSRNRQVVNNNLPVSNNDNKEIAREGCGCGGQIDISYFNNSSEDNSSSEYKPLTDD